MDRLTFKENCVSKDEFLAPTNTMDWPGEWGQNGGLWFKGCSISTGRNMASYVDIYSYHSGNHQHFNSKTKETKSWKLFLVKLRAMCNL